MNNSSKKNEAVRPVGVCFPEARLAEAWIPYQDFLMIFEPVTGLQHGTIFPELVRPYERHPNSPEWY